MVVKATALVLLHSIFVLLSTTASTMATTKGQQEGSDFVFPVIDIGPWTTSASSNEESRLHVAALMEQACREIGFFAIQNHGVNKTVIDNLWKASREFFDLPLDQKLQSKTTNEAQYPYGYERSETLVAGKSLDTGDTTTTTALPDLKETFSLGPDNPLAGMPPRKYPIQPPQLESALASYYQEMEHLASLLLQIFATALRLPREWFDDKMDHHLSALRLVNYWETTSAAKV